MIKFRQGFGRLIRTRRDKGIVVVLDKRIVTRSYGRSFLESLPPCRVMRV
ncbi:helicase c2 [mine drainage metagenome]|uniref:Helicase c2 n=1 Tax=mine drainage metagenome TaxID=410659 RepID=T1BIN9_9ZZZZ